MRISIFGYFILWIPIDYAKESLNHDWQDFVNSPHYFRNKHDLGTQAISQFIWDWDIIIVFVCSPLLMGLMEQ